MTSHQFGWIVTIVITIFIAVAGTGFGETPAESLTFMLFSPMLFMSGIAFGMIICLCRASCERLFPHRYKNKLWTRSKNICNEPQQS